MNQSVGYSNDKEQQQEGEVANAVMESLRSVPAPPQPAAPAVEEPSPVATPAATEPSVATAGEYPAASSTTSRPTSPEDGVAGPAGAGSPQQNRQARQPQPQQQSTPRKPTLQNMPGNGSPAASPAHAAAARARHVPLAQPPRAGQATMPPAGAAGLRPPPSSGFRGFDT